jgi:hypothetical protein
MFFHLNHLHDDNQRRVGVALCLRAQVQVKTLFITNNYFLKCKIVYLVLYKIKKPLPK